MRGQDEIDQIAGGAVCHGTVGRGRTHCPKAKGCELVSRASLGEIVNRRPKFVIETAFRSAISCKIKPLEPALQAGWTLTDASESSGVTSIVQPSADASAGHEHFRLRIEGFGVGTWDLDLVTKELEWSDAA